MKRFHSTLHEHVFVVKLENSQTDITTLMAYTNHRDHLDLKDALDLVLNHEVINNYIQKHEKKLRIICNHVYETNLNHKTKVIQNKNVTRYKPANFAEIQIAY